MSAPAKTSLKQELLDIQKQYWDAMKTADTKTLSRLTADRFTMVMEEGITDADKSEFVEMMTAGDMKLKSYKLDESNATARELSPGVALLAYRAHSDFERQGKLDNMENFFSTIFVKKGNGWVGAAGSAARAAPAR
jgi:hypothetical protein